MTDPNLSTMRAVAAPDVPDDIVAAEAELRAAQLAADVAALDRLIGDDLLFAGPDGQLGTKAQDLEAHGSGVVRFRHHRPEELRARRVGSDVVVTSLHARLTLEVAGTLVAGTYRYTRISARERNGAWPVVGGQVAAVAPAA